MTNSRASPLHAEEWSEEDRRGEERKVSREEGNAGRAAVIIIQGEREGE